MFIPYSSLFLLLGLCILLVGVYYMTNNEEHSNEYKRGKAIVTFGTAYFVIYLYILLSTSNQKSYIHVKGNMASSFRDREREYEVEITDKSCILLKILYEPITGYEHYFDDYDYDYSPTVMEYIEESRDMEEMASRLGIDEPDTFLQKYDPDFYNTYIMENTNDFGVVTFDVAIELYYEHNKRKFLCALSDYYLSSINLDTISMQEAKNIVLRRMHEAYNKYERDNSPEPPDDYYIR